MNLEKYNAIIRGASNEALKHGVPFENLLGSLSTLAWELNQNRFAVIIKQAAEQEQKNVLLLPRNQPFPQPPENGEQAE